MRRSRVSKAKVLKIRLEVVVKLAWVWRSRTFDCVTSLVMSYVVHRAEALNHKRPYIININPEPYQNPENQ